MRTDGVFYTRECIKLGFIMDFNWEFQCQQVLLFLSVSGILWYLLCISRVLKRERGMGEWLCRLVGGGLKTIKITLRDMVMVT